jgi:hypothetical protein
LHSSKYGNFSPHTSAALQLLLQQLQKFVDFMCSGYLHSILKHGTSNTTPQELTKVSKQVISETNKLALSSPTNAHEACHSKQGFVLRGALKWPAKQ